MPEPSIIDDLGQGETAILLSQLRDEPFMPRSSGRKLDKSVAFRWAKSGVGGVTLESLKTPTGIITTRSATLRFFGRLSRGKSSQTSAPSMTPRQRQRQIEGAKAQLLAAGI
jgi:hypothetical protein